jgi:hypothetical protein
MDRKASEMVSPGSKLSAKAVTVGVIIRQISDVMLTAQAQCF